MQPNWLKILLIGATITIIATIVLQLLTPKTSSPVIVQSTASKTNIDGSFSSFSGLNYTGQLPTTGPKTLPLVSLRLSDEVIQAIKNKLITTYNLEKNPELTEVWISDTYLLNRNTNSAEYIFDQIASYEPIENSPALDLASAQTTAETFIQETLQIPDLKRLDTKTVYYKMEGPHYDQTTSYLADLVELNYSWTIEGIPVYLPNKFQSSIKFLIDKERNIKKLSFPLSIPSFEPANTNVPLITIQAALQQLNSGNGSVLAADLVNTNAFDVTTIVTGDLNKVSLEYRIDPDLNLAVPYYRFEGLIKNKQGAAYQAQLITPAVASAPQ